MKKYIKLSGKLPLTGGVKKGFRAYVVTILTFGMVKMVDRFVCQMMGL